MKFKLVSYSIIISLLFQLIFVRAISQHSYVAPTDPQVLSKLHEWQNLKFGLFMHWGTYSQWGIVESWSLCPEDEGWTQRKGPFSANYFDYKMAYENLQTSFNPVKFDPSKWVKAAQDAGMRYVVFTTKHHDGFCMFDTHQTDYKITSTLCPFSSDPRSNVAKVIFDRFREAGFMTGAYFSKPDWHSENYWWPYFPPKDRNVNYDPAKHPDKWTAFKDFTYNQIRELMTDYGKMDILWLDGGWVRPLSTVDTSVEWQKGIKVDQDIDMPKIAGMARDLQPGILIVDRTVPGLYENYTTPEQQVPDKPLNYPWETCMTMGNSWSYVPNDHYKSSADLIRLLVKIVSRGGNFLLNIGPGPEGDWDPVAYDRLHDMGEWMKINSEGIYGSEPVRPYSEGPVFFTQVKKDKRVYAYYLGSEKEDHLPETILLPDFGMNKKDKVRLLGFPSDLKWKKVDGKIEVRIPSNGISQSRGRPAWCFRISHSG